MALWIVLAIIAVICVAAVAGFRWFRAYRYTEAWRKGELRGAMLGMMVWIGGFFGYRLPPPPETNVTFAAGKNPSPSSPIAEDAIHTDDHPEPDRKT
ncbi:MAG TPA: hypothetical protein VET65_08715 [Candidatus Limnocylindrales bacterium]|nr:hypothetical protein [Candidatus Limnocylindrales bacterium]